jgi:hypothetical protein
MAFGVRYFVLSLCAIAACPFLCRAQVATQPGGIGTGFPEVIRSVRTDFESISGLGTVEVSPVSERLFRVRISLSDFNPRTCAQIYNHELALAGLFPYLNFDFYFSGPELARAIKREIESISGPGTVDVSVQRETLVTVRIAVPRFSYDLYNRIFDRELELYRLFQDLNFDFYLLQTGG